MLGLFVSKSKCKGKQIQTFYLYYKTNLCDDAK
jgi:hypothetical protein